ncbi:cytochrome P450 [Pacificimonas sp. ICDLI1SI03]
MPEFEQVARQHEVNTVEDCTFVLKDRNLRQALYDEAGMMMAHSLVNLHGKEHRERRNAEAKIFRKPVFLEYERKVLPRTLQETIAPFLARGKGDLVDLGYRIMMNLTVDFAGIDRPERSAEETEFLVHLLKEFSLAPSLGQSRSEDISEKKTRIRKAMREFDKDFLSKSIARRSALVEKYKVGELEEAELPRDVLTALLLAQDKLNMSEEEFLQEGIFYALAGAHTTVHSLTHALHEVLTWMETHPEDRARLRDDPFFVQQCVFESLRLHPSSPVAKRRALCPVHLPDDERADEGDTVVANLYLANRDENIFGPDADRFNPHRHVAENVAPHGVSMGLGMHACLGRNLAIGVEPRPNSAPEDHQYGIVPLIVKALLEFGVQKDPAGIAKKDEGITRITWAEYPILFQVEGTAI